MTGQLQIVPDEPCPHGCESGFIDIGDNTHTLCPIHGPTLTPKQGGKSMTPTEVLDDIATDSGQVLMPLFSWRGEICSERSGLDPGVRLVAMALSLHMNEKGGSAKPSLKELANETGYSRRQTLYHLQTLMRHKWLKAVKRDRLPTVYSARFPPGWKFGRE